MTALTSILDGDLPKININEPDFWQDIHTPLANARERAPAMLTTDGAIYVLRFDDIETVLKDPRFVASDLLALQGLNSGPVWEWWMRVMFSQNPPAHTRLRGAVNRVFTPRRVEAFRAEITRQAEALLAPCFERCEGEVIGEVSHTLASDVTAAYIGIPRSDWGQFKEWTTEIGLAFGAAGDLDIRTRVEAALAQLDEYVADLLNRCQADPGDNLLSALLDIQDDGERLSRRELIDLVENLMFAGHDTTRSAIGVALKVLAENPDLFRLVRADHQLVPGAAEEVLRYENIIFTTLREAAEELEFIEYEVPAGQPLAVCLPAGCRDPRRFAEPTRIDPTRADRSIAFGGGIHYCLGAPLARAEIQEVIRLVTSRCSAIELMKAVEWVPMAHIRRPTEVRVSFEVA